MKRSVQHQSLLSFTCGHGVWTMTDATRSRMQWPKMRVLQAVIGVTRHDRYHNTTIRGEFQVHPPLLGFRSMLQWFGYLIVSRGKAAPRSYAPGDAEEYEGSDRVPLDNSGRSVNGRGSNCLPYPRNLSAPKTQKKRKKLSEHIVWMMHFTLTFLAVKSTVRFMNTVRTARYSWINNQLSKQTEGFPSRSLSGSAHPIVLTPADGLRTISKPLSAS